MTSDRSVAAAMRVSVPGKLMLSGEYAVLAGGPAVLACVDRYVRATLQPLPDGIAHSYVDCTGFANARFHWRATAAGVDWDEHAAPALLTALLEAFAPTSALAMYIDSSAFYADGRKLGLGSSAAVAVAAGALLGAQTGRADWLDTAMQAHRHYQGGRGSGADLAAVAAGRLVRVQFGAGQRRLAALDWPQGLLYQPVALPGAADTAAMVARFERWRDSDESAEALVARLASDAGRVAETWSAGGGAAAVIDALNDYTERLLQIDRIAGIGYGAGGHRQLRQLADHANVLYKPCGAGGGDFGIALATSARALERFAAQARARGVTLPDFTIGAAVPELPAAARTGL